MAFAIGEIYIFCKELAEKDQMDNMKRAAQGRLFLYVCFSDYTIAAVMIAIL